MNETSFSISNVSRGTIGTGGGILKKYLKGKLSKKKEERKKRKKTNRGTNIRGGEGGGVISSSSLNVISGSFCFVFLKIFFEVHENWFFFSFFFFFF